MTTTRAMTLGNVLIEPQRQLTRAGIAPVAAADESTTGPAYMLVIDSDGNPILIDQHV